jgi:hypothetical protein
MNSSGADSRVNCLKTSDVSETLSLHPQGKRSLALRMETECVSETSEVFKQLTRLSARKDLIQADHSFRGLLPGVGIQLRATYNPKHGRPTPEVTCNATEKELQYLYMSSSLF